MSDYALQFGLAVVVLIVASAAVIMSRRNYIKSADFERSIEALRLEFRRSIDAAHAATIKSVRTTPWGAYPRYPFSYVTITGNCCQQLSRDDAVLAMVTMALAGAAAERYFCDPLDDGSDQIDLEMARRYLIRDGFGPLQIGAETLSPPRRCRPASRHGAPAHSPDCDALLQRGSLTSAKGGPCIHGPPHAFEEKKSESKT